MVTGFMNYNWLPNESYDDKKHISVDYSMYEVSNGVTPSNDVRVEQVWKSKLTGEIFTRQDFVDYRFKEALRLAIIAFLYGLIACIFYSYKEVHAGLARGYADGIVPKTRVIKSFLDWFKASMIINLCFATFTFFTIYR
jgi:hypothetical protein